MVQHTALHARLGTEAEFSDPNHVIPAGVVCLVQDATTKAVEELRFGDGVTEFTELAAFTPAP